jgi:hypothetical protein
LFHYDGISTKEYKNGFTNIDPGLGYWLIVRNQTNITTGEGHTVRIDSTRGFEIDLIPGWNQIGNPFNMNLYWDDVIIDNNNLNIGRVKLFYRDTLTEAYDIPPYRGGFVFLAGIQPITVHINPSHVDLHARKRQIVNKDRNNALNQTSWISNLIISNGNLANSLSGFGMHPEADEGKDRHDEVLMPVPMEIIPFELAFNHPDEKYQKFSRDMVQTTDQYIWEFEVKSYNPSQNLTISWENEYFGDNEYKLILNHTGTEKLIDMKEVNAYTFNSSEKEQFRIIFGNDEFINNELKPTHITFGSGFPNPFHDQLTVPFTLPESNSDYLVKVSVYDLTGNLVKQLSNRYYPSGYYTVQWNSLESSSEIQKGIYFIRMETRSKNFNVTMTQKVIKQ